MKLSDEQFQKEVDFAKREVKMKKELKTLKDLKTEKFRLRYSDGVKDAIDKYSKELKEEAVKWIDNKRNLRMNANDFILVFFNITEEDLK